MRSDVGVCVSCGLVELAAEMVPIVDGEYAYRCNGCAVSADAKLARARRERP